MHKNSTGAKLITGIVDNKEERTRSQWAKYLGIDLQRVDNALSALRKKGFMIKPIGTINAFEDSKEGVLKYVLDSIHDTREAVANNNKANIPRLANQFRLVEEMVSKWPQLVSEARSEVNKLMKFLVNQEEQLKHPKELPTYEISGTRTKQD